LPAGPAAAGDFAGVTAARGRPKPKVSAPPDSGANSLQAADSDRARALTSARRAQRVYPYSWRPACTSHALGALGLPPLGASVLPRRLLAPRGGCRPPRADEVLTACRPRPRGGPEPPSARGLGPPRTQVHPHTAPCPPWFAKAFVLDEPCSGPRGLVTAAGHLAWVPKPLLRPLSAAGADIVAPPSTSDQVEPTLKTDLSRGASARPLLGAGCPFGR